MTGRRVVLADDFSPILREVAKLLQGSFEIVGTAADGQSALDSAIALNAIAIVTQHRNRFIKASRIASAAARAFAAAEPQKHGGSPLL